MRRVIFVLLTAALVLTLAGSAMAQLDLTAKSFYGQGMLVLPFGGLGDQAGIGIGGGGGVTVPYSELLNFRAELGLILFAGKDIEFLGTKQEWSTMLIPATVLGQYRMKVEDPYYLLGGLALTLSRSSYDSTTSTILGTQTLSSDDNGIEFDLTVGGGYDVTEQFAVEGRLHLSGAGYLSLHGLYAF